jgi:phosphotransacetylase
LLSLIDRARLLPALPTAVVFPCEQSSLRAAVQAAQQGLISAVYYGPEDKIRELAEQLGIGLVGDVVDTGDSPLAAASQAVADAVRGRTRALMKGSLHTDELLTAVVARESGLRGDSRITHTFVFDIPRYDKLLAVSDAVINISPDVRTKADAIVNACQMLRALDIRQPKIAIAAAVETINPAIAATLDAQAIVAMARQGRFGDALVEGPMGLDVAISWRAAQIKGLQSEVAGRPDLVVVPDLNAGNILYKSLVYMAGAECAGVVQGARLPVILTSRADSAFSRLASCALASILAAKGT